VGWWHLSRRVIAGSLPQPWTSQRHQPMGLYCSLYCLLDALPRLELIAADLTQHGVGMKRLAPGEIPPTLPPAVKQGGHQ
jgi:hypothetical protein